MVTNDPGFCTDCGVIRSMLAPSNCKTPQCHWAPRHDSRKIAAAGTETNRDLRAEITRLRAELAASAEALERLNSLINTPTTDNWVSGMAWDGGAFDPEMAAVITERGRFVLAYGATPHGKDE